MNSPRAHQARVLNGQIFFFLIFLIKLSMLAGQGGVEKWGTRAHQARVPKKVVDPYIVRKQCYIVRKQCFWTNYFQN